MNYKFNEGNLIEEFKQYVDSTYKGHYGANKENLQSLEVISARGRGIDFCSGNIDKYNDRYGKKGTVEDYRKDIIKIIHYGFLLLNEHDKKYGKAVHAIPNDFNEKLIEVRYPTVNWVVGDDK